MKLTENMKEYKHNHYLKNKERHQTMGKAYYQAHKKEILEKNRIYLKKYYIENRKREIDRVAQWKKDNPEKHKAQLKRYYERKEVEK